jgi:hypothetical protein
MKKQTENKQEITRKAAIKRIGSCPVSQRYCFQYQV